MMFSGRAELQLSPISHLKDSTVIFAHKPGSERMSNLPLTSCLHTASALSLGILLRVLTPKLKYRPNRLLLWGCSVEEMVRGLLGINGIVEQPEL